MDVLLHFNLFYYLISGRAAGERVLQLNQSIHGDLKMVVLHVKHQMETVFLCSPPMGLSWIHTQMLELALYLIQTYFCSVGAAWQCLCVFFSQSFLVDCFAILCLFFSLFLISGRNLYSHHFTFCRLTTFFFSPPYTFSFSFSCLLILRYL